MIASSFSYYASISFNFITGSQESFLFSDKTRNPPAKDVFKRNPANGNGFQNSFLFLDKTRTLAAEDLSTINPARGKGEDFF
ncbi:hypothetical protein PGT21_029384 [Puccinia graminis f. sp. tritici]|uniref:Uncharacterized protein n=1 Tax=Puccinia graminis f. sp. tritici TaxID=56615 RepID=A0A5B0NZT3_PUCGR|nr:hypothetical protein PGT21_029384 [Puccinia graminis f. sp. tritici]